MKKYFLNLAIILALFIVSTSSYSQNSLWSWGANTSGQLGDGTNTNSNVPIQITQSEDWVAVSAGGAHTLAIRNDGTLWGWGRNDYGQVGDGTNTDKLTPVQIGEANDWAFISADFYFSLGIRSNGTLWGWGQNGYGQLGNGTTTNSNVPVQVGDATNWIFVATGNYHSLGIRSDNTLWAWGKNLNGQLGDGTNTSSSIPVQVGSANNWIAADGGSSHSIGLKSDGSVWACGRNNYGQLGNGTFDDSNIPVQVSILTDCDKISSGALHSFAIKNDGTLWAWGRNQYGRLGDGTTTDRTTPVQIGTDADWTNISAGYSYSLGTRGTGILWACGQNSYGQLGDGTTTNRTSPVQVGILENWASVSAGSGHTMGFISTVSIFPPSLLTPGNNSKNLAGNVLLSWTEVENAVSYSLQVATDNSFENIVLDLDGLTETEYNFTDLEVRTKYFWRVNASDAEATSQWSTIWAFSTLPWEFLTTSANDASIMVPTEINPMLGERQIANGDIIGVFYQRTPGEWYCCGFKVWNGNNLGIAAFGDDLQTEIKDGLAVNEPFTFRFWDSLEDTELNAIATYEVGPSIYQVNGFSVLSSLNTFEENSINIELTAGWNQISSNILPLVPDMYNIFENINEVVNIVKDDDGLLYIPSQEINQIGNWNIANGYLVHINSAVSLQINGAAIAPNTAINLDAGWNFIPFYPNSAMAIETALASLGNSVILVKNNNGDFYYPNMFLNKIGNMIPGQAYWIYLSESSVLIYP